MSRRKFFIDTDTATLVVEEMGHRIKFVSTARTAWEISASRYTAGSPPPTEASKR